MGETRQHGSIKFYEDGHRYVDEDTGELFTSVTQLIHLYQQEFESDKISARVAKREDRTQEEVLAEWKQKAEIGCDYGTVIHSVFERMFMAPGRLIIPRDEHEANLLVAFRRTKQLELDGDVYPEQLVYNKKFKLAGQSDLIHLVPKDQFDVGDWKTNLKFRYHDPYNNYLKYPLTHLSQCEFNLYALQLSTYGYFYELMTGLKCRKLFILYYWRDHNIFQVIPLNYMKLEVMMMIKHYGATVLNITK
jgi:hypothetical protein